MNSTVLRDCREPEAILRELSEVIEKSQSALLGNNPQELDNCISRQRTLCEELEFSLREYASAVSLGVDPKTAPSHLVLNAMKAREQNRLFSALLRRMRHNLEIMRNSLMGSSLEYTSRGPTARKA